MKRAITHYGSATLIISKVAVWIDLVWRHRTGHGGAQSAVAHGREPTAEAIRLAYEDGGELAGVVELTRHFPLIADSHEVRMCVRTIASWKPLPLGPSGLTSLRARWQKRE